VSGVSEHDVERRFKDLPVEEQRALLASMGEPLRDYEPIHPRGTNWRKIIERIWAPIAALVGVLVKFGFLVFKFFGIFISVGAYALLWGWKFGVGFVLLILVHEMGHFFAARAQGVHATLPTFIPFVGAYVLIKNQPRDPWRSALIALAGPALGAIGAAGCWIAGNAYGSNLLLALAYAGFLLNLINLVPAGWFDGGAVARAWRQARQSRSGAALPIGLAYVGLIALLIIGMIATHVPQHRL
jgi:Zn-dependent protease